MGRLPEESKRNRGTVFCHQLLSLPLHRKIKTQAKQVFTGIYQMKEKLASTPVEKDGGNPAPSHT